MLSFIYWKVFGAPESDHSCVFFTSLSVAIPSLPHQDEKDKEGGESEES